MVVVPAERPAITVVPVDLVDVELVLPEGSSVGGATEAEVRVVPTAVEDRPAPEGMVDSITDEPGPRRFTIVSRAVAAPEPGDARAALPPTAAGTGPPGDDPTESSAGDPDDTPSSTPTTTVLRPTPVARARRRWWRRADTCRNCAARSAVDGART